MELKELEQKIGYSFHNKDLMKKALTHSSYLNEHHMKKPECNERLEFLGDAVLEMVTSEYFYKTYPDYMEGDLSKIRATLVCEKALGISAQEIDLGQYLLLSKGMDNEESRHNDSITADAFEALIAAIFLDAGLEEAKKLIYNHVLNDLENKLLYNDAKTILQERAQKMYKKVSYQLVAEEGPDHKHQYTVEVLIDGVPMEQGSGRNKKQAEQNAAFNALKKM